MNKALNPKDFTKDNLYPNHYKRKYKNARKSTKVREYQSYTAD